MHTADDAGRPEHGGRATPTLAAAWIALLSLACFGPPEPARIQVDFEQNHQILRGWSAVAHAHADHPDFDRFVDPLLDTVVDAGIDRIRLEVQAGLENDVDYWALSRTEPDVAAAFRCHRYVTVNDDDDPRHFTLAANGFDIKGFQWSELDRNVERVIRPLAARLRDRNAALWVNLTYVAFTQNNCGPYVHGDPEEYAEFLLATFVHLDRKYGFVPDSVEVLLEPDNVPFWHSEADPTLIGRAAERGRQRLLEAGYAPEWIAPSVASLGELEGYVDRFARGMQIEGGSLADLSGLSWHCYGKQYNPANVALAGRLARRHGLASEMLECWSAALWNHIHQDLVLGNASAWQQGALSAVCDRDSDPCNVGGYWTKNAVAWLDLRTPGAPKVELGATTRYTQMYMKYLHRGARRIGATTAHPDVEPSAFVNADGKTVVVVQLRNRRGIPFAIAGLPTGRYGLRYATEDRDISDVALDDQLVGGPGDVVTATHPSTGVLTVFQR